MRFKFGRYIFFFFLIYLVSTSSDKQRVGGFFFGLTFFFFLAWQKLREFGSSISMGVFSERFQRVSKVDRGTNYGIMVRTQDTRFHFAPSFSVRENL